MSFILDALKKSETDRQQRGSAEFAKVPASSGPARPPAWLLLLGLLLAINLVVLLGLWLRPAGETGGTPVAAGQAVAVVADAATAAPPGAAATPAPGGPPPSSFANRVAEAKRNAPAADTMSAAEPRSEAGPASLPAPRQARPAPAVRTTPTIYELIADGSIVLPELHLDIHVYSDTPEDRFVFINMSKQRERSQLSEGPVVDEITPEGVILSYRGTSFLLPRD